MKESLKLDVTNSRKFIYTPLHGVGGAAMERLISSMNIPQERCVFVPEQEKPDPDFPTLSFPNPEEVGALNLAYELADKEQGALIVANDPDADRFSAAEKVRCVFQLNQLPLSLTNPLMNPGVNGTNSPAIK